MLKITVHRLLEVDLEGDGAIYSGIRYEDFTNIQHRARVTSVRSIRGSHMLTCALTRLLRLEPKSLLQNLTLNVSGLGLTPFALTSARYFSFKISRTHEGGVLVSQYPAALI